MTTFNRTWRSPKFFLCTHVTEEDYLGFEPVKERFSHFTFLCYGKGKVYAFNGDDVEVIDSGEPKTLMDVSKHINYSVVGQAKANTKIISFNSTPCIPLILNLKGLSLPIPNFTLSNKIF